MSESQLELTDISKALEALPVIISTVAAARSTLTADQHADLLQKAGDLLTVASNSANSVATSGLVGTPDSQDLKNAVAAVNAAEPAGNALLAAWNGLKKAFAWN